MPGNRGYKYFGAARDLPGVRELFETETGPSGKRTRAELMKEVDAQYYGFRDDDDGGRDDDGPDGDEGGEDGHDGRMVVVMMVVLVVIVTMVVVMVTMVVEMAMLLLQVH